MIERIKYKPLNGLPSEVWVDWGININRREMILNPCAKETRKRGQGATDFRNTCVTPTIASITRIAGSHQVCELSLNVEGGKSKIGTN